MSVCVFLRVAVSLLLIPPVAGDYAQSQGLGLLRLHSTFRHDLKIYASDEGRVQMTAAAFARVSTVLCEIPYGLSSLMECKVKLYWQLAVTGAHEIYP